MKRVLVALAISFMMVTNIISATVSMYTDYADKLATINVFKGTGNGYELERVPTRIEGLIMMIRLLGKEDDALALPKTESHFNDVPDWGVQYTNYAYDNGITNGIGDGKFGSDSPMNADSYYTYLLRALGYDDSSGDFKWNTAVDYANTKNMMTDELYSQLKNDEFLRDHVAISSYNALYTKMKGEEKTLLDSLVDSGDIDAATALGLEIVKISITELDKEAEFVVITNSGSKDVDISGWSMVSVTGNQTFTFPEGTTILANQSIKLTSGKAIGTGDFDMANTNIWNNNDEDDAELLDANGSRIDYWYDE